MERKYGLFTAIAMIVGIVIGSGIFFKSDDILRYTEGNIALGVLIFIIAALCVIFGSLAIGELASRTDKPGGLITYAEEFTNDKFACAFGWFQLFIYYPTLVAVVSWVVGIYATMLFNIEGTLENQIIIGLVFIIGCFIVNALAEKMGVLFQNASTIIKLIPLIIIAIAGFLFGDPQIISNQNTSDAIKNSAWIAAIVPIIFTFDGWVVSTSFAHQIKDSKKNMPKALIISPIIILVVYVLYFVGISVYVGPENILTMGNEHVYEAGSMLLGSIGAKAILTFVLISVMGTVNGLIIGITRLPYSLALKGMLPKANKIKIVSEKWNVPLYSVLFAFCLSIGWMIVHYVSMSTGFLGNSDVSEIAIVMSYVLYTILYLQVIRLWKKGEIKSIIRGIINPIFAIVGSGIILLGGLQDSMFPLQAGFCFLVMGISYVYMANKQKIN